MKLTSCSEFKGFKFLSKFSFFFLCILCLLWTGAFENVDAYMLQDQSAGGTKSVNGEQGVGQADLFTGAMSYSVPITVPPGRNGMQPNLSLNYNSNLSNQTGGLIGVGWGLNVGSIERNTTFGFDPTSDEYILRMPTGTSELVKISANEYRAKINEKFLEIKKIGDYWEVTDKNGLRYYFGRTVSSRQEDPSNTIVYKWCIDYIQDTNDNYIVFFYFKDSGQIYLDNIKYGNNFSNTVKFYYELRNDSLENYKTLFGVKTKYRLVTIDLVSNGERLGAYALEYDTDLNSSGDQYSSATGRSILTAIYKYGSDVQLSSGKVVGGSSLLVSRFQAQGWGGIAPASETNIDSWDNPYVPNLPGDFNGDGRTDLLVWHKPYAQQYNLYLANENGFDPAIPTGIISWDNPDLNNQVVGDFNGDGKADLLMWHRPFLNYRFNLYISNGEGFEPAEETDIQSFDNTRVRNIAADFNGDGLTDFLVWHAPFNNGRYNLYLCNGNGFDPAIPTDVESWDNPRLNNQVVGDFNGDGKADLLMWSVPFMNSRFNLYLSNGEGFEPAVATDVQTFDNPRVRNIAADYNGDGLTDFLVWNAPFNNGKYNLYLCNGNGFDPAIPTDVESWDNPNLNNQVVGDFNGDGKADLLMWAVPFMNSRFNLYLSNGEGFEPAVATDIQTFDDPDLRNVVGDFNGDGISDFLVWHAPFNNHRFNLYASTTKPDLLDKITNQFGGSTTVEYEPSTTYQNTQLHIPLQTVKSITQDDGNNLISATTYDYAGGYYNIGEREFRGFHYSKMTGPVGPDGKQVVTENWYHQGDVVTPIAESQDYPSNPNFLTSEYKFLDNTGPEAASEANMKGKPYRVRVSDKDDPNTIYSKTLTTYHDNLDAGASYFNPIKTVVNYIYDGGSYLMTQVDYDDYDNYGNVLLEVNHGDMVKTDDDFTIERAYYDNSVNHLVGFLKYERMFKGLDTSGTKKSENTYYYDETLDFGTPMGDYNHTFQSPTKGNLTSIVRWNDNEGEVDVQTWTQYDDYPESVTRQFAPLVFASRGLFREPL